MLVALAGAAVGAVVLGAAGYATAAMLSSTFFPNAGLEALTHLGIGTIIGAVVGVVVGARLALALRARRQGR